MLCARHVALTTRPHTTRHHTTPHSPHRRAHAVVAVAAASSDSSNRGSGSSNGTSNGVRSSQGDNTLPQAQPNPKYQWTFEPAKPDPKVQEIPVNLIRRPLGRTRANDQAKVDALMKSIMDIGLQEPIDVLLVDGVYYGFSGCHRFEAHQRLGLPTIKARVRRANQQVLKMHMM